MSKWMAVMALGAMMICGCKMMHKDKATTEPMKMSTGAAHCTACETPKAK